MALLVFLFFTQSFSGSNMVSYYTITIFQVYPEYFLFFSLIQNCFCCKLTSKLYETTCTKNIYSDGKHPSWWEPCLCSGCCPIRPRIQVHTHKTGMSILQPFIIMMINIDKQHPWDKISLYFSACRHFLWQRSHDALFSLPPLPSWPSPISVQAWLVLFAFVFVFVVLVSALLHFIFLPIRYFFVSSQRVHRSSTPQWLISQQLRQRQGSSKARLPTWRSTRLWEWSME